MPILIVLLVILALFWRVALWILSLIWDLISFALTSAGMSERAVNALRAALILVTIILVVIIAAN